MSRNPVNDRAVWLSYNPAILVDLQRVRSAHNRRVGGECADKNNNKQIKIKRSDPGWIKNGKNCCGMKAV